MKKILFAAFAALSMIACNKDDATTIIPDINHTPDGAIVAMRFTDETPTRAFLAEAAAAESCEKSLSSLSVYVFNAKGDLITLRDFTASELTARTATFVLIAGIILLATTDNAWVCWIGVGLIAVSALFSIVTLPVEYNASERALAWLESSRTMQGAELAQAREALTWAARTYLVAALSAIATVLYYAMLILGRGNNRD